MTCPPLLYKPVGNVRHTKHIIQSRSNDFVVRLLLVNARSCLLRGFVFRPQCASAFVKTRPRYCRGNTNPAVPRKSLAKQSASHIVRKVVLVSTSCQFCGASQGVTNTGLKGSARCIDKQFGVRNMQRFQGALQPGTACRDTASCPPFAQGQNIKAAIAGFFAPRESSAPKEPLPHQ